MPLATHPFCHAVMQWHSIWGTNAVANDAGGPHSTPNRRHAPLHSPSRTPPQRDTKSSTRRAIKTTKQTGSAAVWNLSPARSSAASSEDSAGAPLPQRGSARAGPATPNRAEAPSGRNRRQLREAGRDGGRAVAARSRHSDSPPEIQTSFVRPQKQLRQRAPQTAPEQVQSLAALCSLVTWTQRLVFAGIVLEQWGM